MIMFVSKQHFLFIFFSVYKHRLTNTAPYAKGYENINFQAELSQKYKAGNRGVGKKFACKSEKRLFGLGPFDTFDVCVCVCVCVGLVLSDNTLTGLRLLKDRIKADTQDTPTRPAKDITAMLLAPPSIAN